MKKLISLSSLLFLYSMGQAQCTTGATQLLGDGKLYGCVEGQWKKLTEDVVSNAGILGNLGGTQNLGGIVQGRETNNMVSQLPNIGYTPKNVTDAPQHVIGKIFYSAAEKHFYEGVTGGLWHQIDNMLPIGWNLSLSSIRYISSVYDNNYYPMDFRNLAAQPSVANISNSAPDSTLDPLLNYQGIIGSYSGVQDLDIDQAFENRIYAVNATLTSSGGSNFSLPSIVSEAYIPSMYIKNANGPIKVFLRSTLNNSEKIITGGTQNIILYLSAEIPINLVQLDMNQGIGKDGKGILLTTFQAAGTAMEIRLLPGIPDKFAGQRTNSYAGIWAKNAYEHDMFSMPLIDNRGNTWLNFDLGAGYSQLKNPRFYPLQNNIISGEEINYQGSLYQWQRKSDGHELLRPNFVITTSQNRANSWEDANTRDYIDTSVDPSATLFYQPLWVKSTLASNGPFNLWTATGSNNPCPSGMYIPNFSNYAGLYNTAQWQNYNTPLSNYQGWNYPTQQYVTDSFGAFIAGFPMSVMSMFNPAYNVKNVRWTSESIDRGQGADGNKLVTPSWIGVSDSGDYYGGITSNDGFGTTSDNGYTVRCMKN